MITLPPPAPIRPQQTGQSTATIDAAYEGVFSQLDALAAQGQSHQPATGSPTSPASTTAPPSYRTMSPVITQPASILHRTNITEGSRIRSPGPGGYASRPRLGTVSERTEPPSATTGSRSGSVSPTGTTMGRPVETASTMSTTSIAQRFPLPPSPVKGPRPSESTTQSSPSKASSLIKMFESRSAGDPGPISQPSFAPAMSRTMAAASRSPLPPTPREPPSAPEAAWAPSSVSSPPSSYRTPTQTLFGASPPRRSPSPLSHVKTMIASWRARTESPSRGSSASPASGATTPRRFGRDRGWNVSIRRRRRDGGQEETALAEQAEEPPAQEAPTSPANQGDTQTAPGATSKAESISFSERRTSSAHSEPRSTRSTGPIQLSGEVSDYTY